MGEVLLFATGDADRQSCIDPAGAAVTRDEQIDAAFMLLDPPPHEHEAWRHQIEHILDYLDWWCKAAAGFKAPGTKPGKAALRTYVNALHQLQKAYDALPPELRPWFSLAETAYIAGTPTVIEREVAKANSLLSRNPRHPNETPFWGRRRRSPPINYCCCGGVSPALHAAANGTAGQGPFQRRSRIRAYAGVQTRHGERRQSEERTPYPLRVVVTRSAGTPGSPTKIPPSYWFAHGRNNTRHAGADHHGETAARQQNLRPR